MNLVDRVRRTIRRHRLASPDTRVVAAFSGGPDSRALVEILRELTQAGDLRLVALAHLNHQLRPAAAGDQQFCARVADDLQLPIVTESCDVKALAARDGRSLEDAAHVARYAFFERVLSAQSADVVAVGHTRDDQAETFLLRLLRGAGSRGLAAMYPRHGRIIRPMLDCSRADVAAFLTQRHLDFVHDASNDDVGIPRNRVRAELLPLLRDRFNPRIDDVLAGEADQARSEHELLERLADEWRAAHVRVETGGQWSIGADDLAAAPEAIASRVLHAVMTEAAAGRLIGFDAIQQALAVAAGTAADFDAPGQRVQRLGADVVLTSRPAGTSGRPVGPSSVPGFHHRLPVPGEVRIPEIGCTLTAELVGSAQNVPAVNGQTVVVPKERVAAGLSVRNRRPGDRLRPSAAGHRKLQDLFVDRKVPRAERDRVPIVVDSDDRIVWVAGYAIDQDFRVSDPLQAVVVLRLKGVGGSF